MAFLPQQQLVTFILKPFSLPVREVGVVVALLIAFGFAAITNQGTKLVHSLAKQKLKVVKWYGQLVQKHVKQL